MFAMECGTLTVMPYWFDGNNLIGQSAADANADRLTRRAFLSELSSYHRSGGGQYLVYFDGDDPDRSAAPPGIAVRFSAPFSSDDAIVRGLEASRKPAEITVVTNDRELTMRCRERGSGTQTWSGFVSKMNSRHSLPRRQTEKQEQVDVDDWVRYFGLNKKEI